MDKKQLKRIEAALTSLVMDEPFFAVLALKFSLVEKNDIDTFSTDGKNLFYNPAFCAGLKEAEIRTILAHEVLHCALGHLWRMPAGADHQTWNEAADHETNWTLEETNILEKNKGRVEPFPFPDKENICMSPEYKGQAAEKIYSHLSKNKKEENQNGQGQGPQQKPGKGKGQGQQGQGQKKGPGMGEFIPQMDKAKAEELKEQWNRATIQAAKIAKGKGNTPEQIKRLIEELVSPKVNWKQILREFLRDIAQDDYNFLKSNPRYADNDFFLPTLHSEGAGKIVFAVDTSGSITQENLKDFLSEAQNCLDELCPKKLTVISCDTKIQTKHYYEPGEKISGKLLGGGGTNFSPVFEEMENEERPDILVYLTDLQGRFPDIEPDYPVIWITQGKKERVPFGNVVRIEN